MRLRALTGHFRDKNAVWSWTELSRRVDGCRTAVIEYDATYDIDASGGVDFSDYILFLRAFGKPVGKPAAW